MDTITTNTQNPRKHFNRIEELAQNISEVGLLQPITVYPFGPDLYRISMGHRRFLACKSLGWQEIPCIVIDCSPEDVDWFMLSENLQREDLTDSEKGEAVEQIRTSQTGTVGIRELAQKLGVSKSDVHRWLQAAGYPEEVKQMIKQEEVTDYAISPIVQLETPQEQVKTAEYIRDNELNYSQAKETVEVIKALPMSIREKLTEEPEYTIVNAKEEFVDTYVEAEVETIDEYYSGNTDYQTIKPMITNCKNALKEDAVRQLKPIEKVKLKGDLQVLKAQIESILAVIDWI